MCGLGNRTARWTRGLTTPTDFASVMVVRLDTSRSCHRVGRTNPHPTTSSDVCFWHKADMTAALGDVRFWGQSGHRVAHAAMSASDPPETLAVQCANGVQRYNRHPQLPSRAILTYCRGDAQ